MNSPLDLMLGIAENIALLIALTFLYSVSRSYLSRISPLLRSVVYGVLFGGIGIVSMLTPVQLAPGIIVDGRFALILLAALFDGELAALLAGALILAFRTYLGGVGSFAAALVVVFTVIFSIILRRRYGEQVQNFKVWHWLVLGEVLATSMMLAMLTLPPEYVWLSISRALLPLGIGYPLVTLFTGLLLSREVKHHDAERLLHESEEKYRSLIENSQDAVFLTTVENTIHDFNPAALDLMGYTREELLALKATELYVNPADRLKTITDLERGHVQNYEIVLKHKDGSSIYCDLSATLWHDNAGKLLGYQSFLRDITALKEAQKELESHKEELEDRVIKRTIELTRAYEQLQALAKVKDEFIATVSHELRTPIQTMKLYHHLLEKEMEPAAALPTLNQETARLAGLIEDLLSFSEMTEGQDEINPELVDLNKLVAEGVEEQRPLADKRELTLELVTANKVTPVVGDMQMLGRVLNILLTNSLNYTPQGGRVTVRTFACKRDEKQWAGFSVSNSGPSIPEEERKQLFERFFRGKAALQTGTHGMGLGLAFAREIVERHDGQIRVENPTEENEAVTFTVVLPC